MGSEKEWDGFRSWLHSIAVVTFDLELGQVSSYLIKVVLYKLYILNLHSLFRSLRISIREKAQHHTQTHCLNMIGPTSVTSHSLTPTPE